MTLLCGGARRLSRTMQRGEEVCPLSGPRRLSPAPPAPRPRPGQWRRGRLSPGRPGCARRRLGDGRRALIVATLGPITADAIRCARLISEWSSLRQMSHSFSNQRKATLPLFSHSTVKDEQHYDCGVLLATALSICQRTTPVKEAGGRITR